MEKNIKIELIELAKSIVDGGESINLTDVGSKARALYEKAVIANYIQKTDNENSTTEFQIDELESSEEEVVEVKKIYIDDLLSDTSSDIIFEEKKEVKHEKSLNDNFSKMMKIGLNDRIAFVKHLFKDDDQAFLDVVKRIDEASSEAEVKSFVKTEIRPKYNDWQGKEVYQNRFFDWISNRFK